MGDRALTVTDIITDGWYDYDAKYGQGGSRHVLPAEVPGAIFDACWTMPLTAHGCWAAGGVAHRFPLGRAAGWTALCCWRPTRSRV